jgi:hypothetical protein
MARQYIEFIEVRRAVRINGSLRSVTCGIDSDEILTFSLVGRSSYNPGLSKLSLIIKEVDSLAKAVYKFVY